MKLKKIEEGMVVHCNTKEEAKELIKWAYECGFSWVDHNTGSHWNMAVQYDSLYTFESNYIYYNPYHRDNILEFSDLIVSELNYIVKSRDEEELTAEEVIEWLKKGCFDSRLYDSGEDGDIYSIFDRYSAEEIVDKIKQYKKDHTPLPPKEPEVEWVYHVLAYDFEGSLPNEIQNLYYKTEQEAIDKAEELTKKYIDNAATFCIDKVCRVKE